MRACVLCDVGRIEVREVPQPRMGARDVLLRIAAVGICGTDAHIFSGHANYNTDSSGKNIPLSMQPQILGHEISGEVAAVGSEVRDLVVGDRVVIHATPKGDTLEAAEVRFSAPGTAAAGAASKPKS